MAQKIGARADQFSLAVLAYQMLTGDRPFEGSTASAIMHHIVHTEAQPVHVVNPLLPLAVDKAFQRALSKDPEKRYLTCTEFGTELERLLALSSQYGTAGAVSPRVTDRPESSDARSGSVPVTSGASLPRSKSRRAMLAAAAAVLVLSLGALVVLFALSGRGVTERNKVEVSRVRDQLKEALPVPPQPVSVPSIAPLRSKTVALPKRVTAGADGKSGGKENSKKNPVESGPAF
jgi:serine/threonine protein kinase